MLKKLSINYIINLQLNYFFFEYKLVKKPITLPYYPITINTNLCIILRIY